MEKRFDFRDITLVPETVSNINSRSEINIYNDNDKLLGYFPYKLPK